MKENHWEIPSCYENPEDRYLSEVADTVQKRRPDIQAIQVLAGHINFFKANPPSPKSSLSELSRRVKSLRLNVTENECEAVLLS